MRSGLLKKHSSIWLWSARFADLAIIALSGYVAYVLKFQQWLPLLQYRWAALLVLITSGIWFFGLKLYSPMRGRRYSDFFGRLILAWVGAWLCVAVILFFIKMGPQYSRAWIGGWILIGGVVLVAYRLLLLYLLRLARRKGLNQRFVILIGAGALAARVEHNLQQEIWSGYQVLAAIDMGDEANQMVGTAVYPLSELKVLVEQKNVDEIWIALPLQQEAKIREVMEQLQYRTENIRLVPDIFGLNLLNHSMTEVAGLPVLNLRETPMSGFNQVVKRLEDLVLSTLIVIAISPILLVVSVLVKLSSPGPIFYRQERLSWNGQPFMMLKFRSMPVDSEASSGAVWAKPGENRATRVGAFLRKTSLDELPQFLNVLKGDMSIVGPRPERPIFVEQFKKEIPGYMQKHMMKAGITGWAQVNGWRGSTDLSKRIDCDLYYIEHWSLWLDLKIIAMTLVKGFVNRNAY